MAKCTESFNVPYGTEEEEEAVIAELAAKCRKRYKGETVGEVVNFPMADSSAAYMVKCEKPLTLIHLDVCEGWSIPEAHMRGLRMEDIHADIRWKRHIAEAFTRQKS